MTNLVAHPVDLYPGQPPGVVGEHEVPEHAVPRGRIEQLERALFLLPVLPVLDIVAGVGLGRGVVPPVKVVVAVGEAEPTPVTTERHVETLAVWSFTVTFLHCIGYFEDRSCCSRVSGPNLT